MRRANRFFVEDHVWHITHRCHKRDFLLKFVRDRHRWIYWLREASQRLDISVLNYTVTSNHIHLLVRDNSSCSGIPHMMQLIAGRVAQEYNQRKSRKGAFWEDRYHATAIETGTHLWRCLVYVDLNMVRAGVVQHPEEWVFGGYHEIIGSKTRNRILDKQALLDLLELQNLADLERQHRGLIDAAISQQNLERDGRWTESMAVGSSEFATEFHAQLRARGNGCRIIECEDNSVVREGLTAYGADFALQNRAIG